MVLVAHAVNRARQGLAEQAGVFAGGCGGAADYDPLLIGRSTRITLSSTASLRPSTAFSAGAGGTLVALATGWFLAAGYAHLIEIVALIVGLTALAFAQRGAFIGLLALAILDGVPFLDSAQHVISRVDLGQLAALVLLVVVAGWALLDRSARKPAGPARTLSALGALLFLWYVVTIARSLAIDHVGLIDAVVFSRDFLLFSLFLIFLPRVRLDDRDIAFLGFTLGLGVVVFAIGQVILSLGIGQPGRLIHVQQTYEEDGFTRVYSSMTDLVNVALLVAGSALFFVHRASGRRVALPLATLLLVSVIVQLTRARWIGLIAGVVVVGCWFALAGDGRLRPTVRRRLLLGVGALAAFAGVFLLVAPGALPGGSVAHRLVSAFSDVQSGAGTIAIRENVTTVMLSLLGESWAFGLGFIPPAAHYYNSLPAGSIRDSDLGVLNAVMTMGVVGAVLIYLPLLYGLLVCLRSGSRPATARYACLRWGAAAWIVATLLSSITLVTLFSLSGAILTAIVLTVAVRSTLPDAPRLRASP